MIIKIMHDTLQNYASFFARFKPRASQCCFSILILNWLLFDLFPFRFISVLVE